MSASSPKLKAAILVVSETATQDPSTDACIPTLTDVFGKLGNDQWDVSETEIVPDSVLAIQKAIRSWTDREDPVNLIVSSGGTGFATKDVTPEVRDSVCNPSKRIADRGQGRHAVDRQTCARNCVSYSLQCPDKRLC
jgi:molybdopterin biosynthesis enzyme MoaB